MGKPTGFIEWQRLLPKRRAVAERTRDWREVEDVHGPLETDALRNQGGRCMDCGIPFCTQGCPLGNPIPDFADLVWKDRWLDAHKRLAATNDFPEFTGRLCPAPCEGSCVLALDGVASAGGASAGGGAVTIEALEKGIIEHAFGAGWITPQPPRTRSGKKIAIVGSGPAGLAAANQLNRAGHSTTVFEAAARIGGLLRYGIPDFKIEKWVIDRRLALMEAEGVEFRTRVAVGVDPTWTQLRAEHDAVVIAIGAMRPRDIASAGGAVPGRELEGVVMAMDYLVDQNEVGGGEKSAARYSVAGKRVVILGGGDTGSDCLGTAHRQGAAHVTQIELLPAPPTARAATNPWPAWPMIFRTSSSQEEGGERTFEFQTTRLEGEGTLAALVGTRLDTREEVRLPVDTLILALGFVGPDVSALVDQLGIALDARGNLAVDASFATNVPGVYAAGDARRGASLIVWAIAEARELARHVDAALRAGTSLLPVLGRDHPFA